MFCSSGEDPVRNVVDCICLRGVRLLKAGLYIRLEKPVIEGVQEALG